MSNTIFNENVFEFSHMSFSYGCKYQYPKTALYMLYYVIEGEMNITIKNKTYIAHSGEVLFIPGKIGDLFLDYSGTPYQGITLRFRSFPNVAYYDFPPQVICIDEKGRRLIEDIPLDLPVCEEKIWKFYRALSYLEQRMQKSNPKYSDIVDKAIDYMLTHTEYDIPTLARLCMVSESGFRAIFHAVTGESFLTKKHSIQAFQAELLLLSTDLTVEEIGHKVGFASNQRFREIFKRRYGIPPNEFRKKHTSSDRE